MRLRESFLEKAERAKVTVIANCYGGTFVSLNGARRNGGVRKSAFIPSQLLKLNVIVRLFVCLSVVPCVRVLVPR